MKKLTKLQKDFIGTPFYTTTGEKLVVSGLSELGKYKFILTCSACSKDESLFPYGSITCTKDNLLKGRIPCGCGNVRLTECQMLVRVERVLTEKGIKFNSWVGGFKGTKSTVCVTKISTKETWDVFIQTVLYGEANPPSKRKENIETKLQVDYENRVSGVLRKIEDKGGYFGEFLERYKGKETRLIWYCESDHKNTTTIRNVLGGRGCFKCHLKYLESIPRTINGFFYGRTSEEDHLYLYLCDDAYIKIGRTFNVKSRLSSLRRESGCSSMELLYLGKGDHSDVYETEQEVMSELRLRNFSYQSGWSGETFSKGSLRYTLSLLNSTSLTSVM